VFERWNASEDPIDLINLADEAELLRISESHRLAWETFLITVAAIEDRRNERTPFTTEKLQAIMRGDLTSEGRDTSPRDIQFELFIAAQLRLPGASVLEGEPDLRFLYGTEIVGVAAKRVTSLNDDQVQKRARAAAKQIEDQGLRGWIALNLDSRFASIDYDQTDDNLTQEFEATFDSLASALRRAALKPQVLGFMLFGYLYSWRPPVEGTTAPRLHSAPPMRWHRLVDEPADIELFEQFTSHWSDRMMVRLRTLASKDFTGPL